MKLNFGVIEMFNCNGRVIAQLLLLSITITITLHYVPSITITYYYKFLKCLQKYTEDEDGRKSPLSQPEPDPSDAAPPSLSTLKRSADGDIEVSFIYLYCLNTYISFS